MVILKRPMVWVIKNSQNFTRNIILFPALTTDSGVTIYTMSGLRWGLYYDIEKRAEDYSLPPWWQKGKLARSYLVSYLNGDFDDARSLHLKYTSPSTAEEIEKERKEKVGKKSGAERSGRPWTSGLTVM